MYQIENGQEWDTELSFALTADKSITSSKEAKEICRRLNTAAALPVFKNHYDWAMLCIGYCFATDLTEQPDQLPSAPDTGGTEIRTFKMCFQEAHYRLWLVMLSDLLFRRHADRKVSKNDLYHLIQDLWHAGAVALEQLWQKCKAFEADNELAARQLFLNKLAALAAKNAGLAAGQSAHDTPAAITAVQDSILLEPDNRLPETADLSKKITAILQNMGKGVQRLVFQKHGIRQDFYLLQFAEYNDWDKIHDRFCSALAVNPNHVAAERCEGLPHAYTLKIKRPENTWQHLSRDRFQQALRAYRGGHKIPLCLGVDEAGQPVFGDLHEARHILVGGMTGAGKSVMVRTLLYSLFELVPPEQIAIAILDPANDYAVFKDRPNLWGGEIQGCRDEMRGILEGFVEEMDSRLALLQEHNDAKQISELPDTVRPAYLVVMVEELAALLDNDKEAETPLKQLLQEGRKAGIHLIMATQEADSQTFSARFRSNIPSRIALKVSKAGSSDMILGQKGAEKLLGKGDHLVSWNKGEPYFLHGFDV